MTRQLCASSTCYPYVFEAKAIRFRICRQNVKLLPRSGADLSRGSADADVVRDGPASGYAASLG